MANNNEDLGWWERIQKIISQWETLLMKVDDLEQKQKEDEQKQKKDEQNAQSVRSIGRRRRATFGLTDGISRSSENNDDSVLSCEISRETSDSHDKEMMNRHIISKLTDDEISCLDTFYDKRMLLYESQPDVDHSDAQFARVSGGQIMEPSAEGCVITKETDFLHDMEMMNRHIISRLTEDEISCLEIFLAKGIFSEENQEHRRVYQAEKLRTKGTRGDASCDPELRKKFEKLKIKYYQLEKRTKHCKSQPCSEKNKEECEDASEQCIFQQSLDSCLPIEEGCEPCDGEDGCGNHYEKDICETNHCTWLGWKNGNGCTNCEPCEGADGCGVNTDPGLCTAQGCEWLGRRGPGCLQAETTTSLLIDQWNEGETDIVDQPPTSIIDEIDVSSLPGSIWRCIPKEDYMPPIGGFTGACRSTKWSGKDCAGQLPDLTGYCSSFVNEVDCNTFVLNMRPVGATEHLDTVDHSVPVCRWGDISDAAPRAVEYYDEMAVAERLRVQGQEIWRSINEDTKDKCFNQIDSCLNDNTCSEQLDGASWAGSSWDDVIPSKERIEARAVAEAAGEVLVLSPLLNDLSSCQKDILVEKCRGSSDCSEKFVKLPLLRQWSPDSLPELQPSEALLEYIANDDNPLRFSTIDNNVYTPSPALREEEEYCNECINDDQCKFLLEWYLGDLGSDAALQAMCMDTNFVKWYNTPEQRGLWEEIMTKAPCSTITCADGFVINPETVDELCASTPCDNQGEDNELCCKAARLETEQEESVNPCIAGQGEHYLVNAGYTWRTLDAADPNGLRDAPPNNGCQQTRQTARHWLSLPEGYEIVPNLFSEDLNPSELRELGLNAECHPQHASLGPATDNWPNCWDNEAIHQLPPSIIADNNWGTECIILDDGSAWMTKTMNDEPFGVRCPMPEEGPHNLNVREVCSNEILTDKESCETRNTWSSYCSNALFSSKDDCEEDGSTWSAPDDVSSDVCSNPLFDSKSTCETVNTWEEQFSVEQCKSRILIRCKN